MKTKINIDKFIFDLCKCNLPTPVHIAIDLALKGQGLNVNDLVEITPSFKVGDFIIKKDNRKICQINGILNNNYLLGNLNTLELNEFPIRLIDNDFSLWNVYTIEEGDIIVQPYNGTIRMVKSRDCNFIDFHCYCDRLGNNFKHLPSGFTVGSETNAIRPASKVESQKLFKSMKAAGYMYDTESNTIVPIPSFKVGDIIWLKVDKTCRAKVLEVNKKNYKLSWLSSNVISLCDIESVNRRYTLVNEDKSTQIVEIFGKKVKIVDNNPSTGYNCHHCALKDECFRIVNPYPCKNVDGYSYRHFEYVK